MATYHAQPMRERTGALALVLALAAVLAAAAFLFTPANAKSSSSSSSSSERSFENRTPDYDWSWTLAAGKTLHVKGVSGDVRAGRATDGKVHVRAWKYAHRSDPEKVHVEHIESEDGITVCAVYPGSGYGDPNSCEAGESWHSHTRNNDVEVYFVVELPKGVKFVCMNTNGDVEAKDLEASVDAQTVNGSINITTTDLASAETVNGSIEVTVGKSPSSKSQDLKLRSVNGNIVLHCPSSFSSHVVAETVNGEIDSDFPLTVTGKFNSRHLRGSIGSGEGDLAMSTVNGNIHLVSAK